MKKTRTRTRTKSYLPQRNDQSNLHSRDLCTDPNDHFHLKEEERELTRKLKSFYDAGDTQEEIQDTDEYRALANSPLQTYERMATSSDSIRFTTQAVVQLITVSMHSTDEENAILAAFIGTKQTLQFTKKERKLAKLCYKIGQARLQQQVVKALFYNEKIAANMKLLSQIKNYIDDNSDSAKSIAASLSINLTDKKEHKRPNQNQNSENQTTATKTPPLKLVN